MLSAATMPHPLTQIEIIHRLKKVGFTQEQAEVQTQIITEVNENSLATKQDVKDLAASSDVEITLVRKDIREVRQEIKDLRQEMIGGFALVQKEFVLVRKEMELMKSDILVKITIIMSTLLALFGAVQKIFNF